LHNDAFISVFVISTVHSSGGCRGTAPEEIRMIDTRTAPYAALMLRLALGTMFVAHALLKLFVFTLPGTVQFFESLGLPGALAYATFAAELVGGMLLIAGVGTRWVAAALVPVLLGAAWVHSGNGWLFSAPNGGWEYPVFLTLAAAVQALLGDGAYALGGRFFRRTSPRLQAA
jgi:putative oxidoreductase